MKRTVAFLVMALIVVASIASVDKGKGFAETSKYSATGSIKQTIGSSNTLLYVDDVKVDQSSIPMKTVIISIIFKNLDYKPQFFNHFYIKLKDTDGIEYSPEFDSKLPSAYIQSLDIVRGTAIFKIPLTASPSKLLYYSEISEKNDLVVDLSKTKAPPDEPPKSDWVYPSSNKGFKDDDGKIEIAINDEKYSGQYYIVDLTIRNIGKDIISYNPFYAHVKDSAGNLYSYAIFSDPNSLSSGDLQPGNFVRGVIAFDLGNKSDGGGLMFIWDGDLGVGSYINSGQLTKPLSAQDQPNDNKSNQDGGIFNNIFNNTVNGKYINEHEGIEIQFPNGWSGIRFGNLSMVSPNGVNFTKASAAVIIAVIPLNISAFQNYYGISNNNNSVLVSNNSNNNNETGHCNSSESAYTSVNGKSAIHAIKECADVSNTTEYSKSDGYAFITKDKTVIALVFVANSTKAYDTYVGDFEATVKTLKIQKDVVNVKEGLKSMWSLKSNPQKIKMKDKELDLTIDSSSQISNFNFDESNKKLSFTVSGNEGTRGYTSLAVSEILQGPYTITLDGKPFDGADIVKDEETGNTLVTLEYSHSTHDVSIIGTTVVPEFPLPVVGAIAAITIAIVVIFSRTKMIRMGRIW